MCTKKQKKYFEKKNLTQAKYYTSVIYGSRSIRLQQEVDAVLINSHIYTDCFSLTSTKAINLFNKHK